MNNGYYIGDFISKVESYFLKETIVNNPTTKISYIQVDDFLKLGLLTSLHSISWVNNNPNGVISIPTGKTPEFFTYNKELKKTTEDCFSFTN